MFVSDFCKEVRINKNLLFTDCVSAFFKALNHSCEQHQEQCCRRTVLSENID